MKDKDQFIQMCFEQLVEVFDLSQRRQPDDKKKYRTEGLIQAGRVLGVLSEVEAKSLMEKAHLQVFGQTIQQRKQRKTSLKSAIEMGDDEYINIPSILRSHR
ncbi:hypothetical protein [Neptunicella sp.]|uniref:hypothetical protein n=1 Tax=Neptunicella sp. TaxID=2125986 RepID=UPI003F68DE04